MLVNKTFHVPLLEIKCNVLKVICVINYILTNNKQYNSVVELIINVQQGQKLQQSTDHANKKFASSF